MCPVGKRAVAQSSTPPFQVSSAMPSLVPCWTLIVWPFSRHGINFQYVYLIYLKEKTENNRLLKCYLANVLIRVIDKSTENDPRLRASCRE